MYAFKSLPYLTRHTEIVVRRKCVLRCIRLVMYHVGYEDDRQEAGLVEDEWSTPAGLASPAVICSDRNQLTSRTGSSNLAGAVLWSTERNNQKIQVVSHVPTVQTTLVGAPLRIAASHPP